jgi:hypothetical protein
MTFHQSEVMTLAFGAAAGEAAKPLGYRGEFTIAMRSTKVGAGGAVGVTRGAAAPQPREYPLSAPS